MMNFNPGRNYSTNANLGHVNVQVPLTGCSASTSTGSPSYLSDDDARFVFQGNARLGAWRDTGAFRDMPRQRLTLPEECRFCQNNGEEEQFYRSHRTKDEWGVVLCPILRSYTCPVCSASGDKAHTIKYCPRNKDGSYNNGASITDLKKLRNAAGKPSSHRAGRPVAGGRALVGRGTADEGAVARQMEMMRLGQNFPSEAVRHEALRREIEHKSMELTQLRQQLQWQNQFGGRGSARYSGELMYGGEHGLMWDPSQLPRPMEGHLQNIGVEPQLEEDNLSLNLAELREGSRPYPEEEV